MRQTLLTSGAITLTSTFGHIQFFIDRLDNIGYRNLAGWFGEPVSATWTSYTFDETLFSKFCKQLFQV
jgi:hypothetical protein